MLRRCPELKRLPKAKKSVNFRFTTPGSPSALLSPIIPREYDRSAVLDPTHPATFPLKQGMRNTFPSFSNSSLFLRAVPTALLARPETLYPSPPFPSSPRSKPGTINASLLFVITKKYVHKRAVIRNKVSARIKHALSLLVTRGAAVSASDSGTKVVFNEDETTQWILPDWTYIFRPSLEIYRMPHADLIDLLRKSLHETNLRAEKMEKQWSSRKSERNERMTRPTSTPKRLRNTATPQPLSGPHSRPMVQSDRIAHAPHRTTTPLALPTGFSPILPRPSTHPSLSRENLFGLAETQGRLQSPPPPDSQGPSTPTKFKLFFPKNSSDEHTDKQPDDADAKSPEETFSDSTKPWDTAIKDLAEKYRAKNANRGVKAGQSNVPFRPR